jgi:hypothetical protein
MAMRLLAARAHHHRHLDARRLMTCLARERLTAAFAVHKGVGVGTRIRLEFLRDSMRTGVCHRYRTVPITAAVARSRARLCLQPVHRSLAMALPLLFRAAADVVRGAAR